jgi:hypothetical protein
MEIVERGGAEAWSIKHTLCKARSWMNEPVELVSNNPQVEVEIIMVL